MTVKARFHKFSQNLAYWIGTPFAFLLALITVIVWLVTGPLFDYSNTWQLVINTGTTIITFLMVFMIQNTQNRDSQALHLKLDELIRANVHARNNIINIEDLSDEELEVLHAEFCTIQKQYADKLNKIEKKRKQANTPR